MNIELECVECIINQSRRVADAIEADDKLRAEIIGSVKKLSTDFSFTKTPPEVAAPVYKKMSTIAKKEDLYSEIKKVSTKKAETLIPYVQSKIDQSSKTLLTATKVAVAGNVIDLASAYSFDLNEELDKIFHIDFSINDFKKLEAKIADSSTILYIADNAGEHIFDKVYIQTIISLYPAIKIYYMTRGEPIINDVTFEEAKEAGFEKLCYLINSGVDTPGFVYKKANKQSQKLFDGADMIISKGMGNYECLNDSNRKDLFFLFKVKCDVVARTLDKEVGDIICKAEIN